MDIDLLRTFIEVQRTLHFGKASKSLFITQSAVSARIRLLEETMGVKLFTRVRDNIQLTPEGKHLLKSAETILHLWEDARKSIALVGQERTLLVVGGISSLWEIFLADWVEQLREGMPALAMQCETRGPTELVQGLLSRYLDVAFMYDPPKVKELLSREVAPVELILVSRQADREPREAIEEGYIQVDWGSIFNVEHGRWFPDMPPPMLRYDQGRLALNALLHFGGAAYLPRPMVEWALGEEALFVVKNAPSFLRHAYAVYLAKGEGVALVEQALEYLV